MFHQFQNRALTYAFMLLAVQPMAGWAAVDLQWRPAQQIAQVGAIIRIHLFAVSDSGVDQSVGGLEAILVWDPSVLRLVELFNPCESGTCPPNAYDWAQSTFRDDSAHDGLNAPFTGLPANDGDALYFALKRAPPVPPAVATAEGLWVATVMFRILTEECTQLALLSEFGVFSRTHVADGEDLGVDVTGVLGPPAHVLMSCEPPVAAAVGSRVIAVAPVPCDVPLALAVTGDSGNPDVACISRFVQADGTLGFDAVFLTSTEWGTAYVTDAEILPSTTYHTQALCPQDAGPNVLSTPTTVTTWLWGDVNNDGVVYFDDITLVIAGSAGEFPEGVIAENLDLAPCLPDGVIDAEDIDAIERAFAGVSFPCAPPCSGGLGLDDFADFVLCMEGPFGGVAPGCESFDYDVDVDVDVMDLSVFQMLFTASTIPDGYGK